MIYYCDPMKNDNCPKTACYVYGGPCECTTQEEFSMRDHNDDPMIAPEWPKEKLSVKEDKNAKNAKNT